MNTNKFVCNSFIKYLRGTYAPLWQTQNKITIFGNDTWFNRNYKKLYKKN